MTRFFKILRLGYTWGAMVWVMGTGSLLAQQPVIPFSQQGFNIDDEFIDGCTAVMKEEYEVAVEIFEKILEQDRTHHASRYNLARIALIRQQYDRVIEQMRLAIEEDATNYWYYVLLRKAYEGRGDVGRAIEVQQGVVEIFPDRSDEQRKMIELYTSYGEGEKALDVLSKLEKKQGADESLLYQKYNIYAEQGNTDMMLNVLEELLVIAPQQGLYYKLLYDAYVANNDERGAMATLEQLLQQDPENGYALLALFDYHNNKGNTEQAYEYLIEAFGNEQVKLDWKLERLKVLLDEPSKKDLSRLPLDELAGQLRQSYPDNAQIIRILGDILRINNKSDSALIYYRKALEVDPAAFDLWTSLLETSSAQGRFEQMYFDAEEAISFFPNNTGLLLQYAIASARLEKWDQATYALDKIDKKTDLEDDIRAAVLRERGWIELAQGNLLEANELLVKSLSIQETAISVEIMGDILFRQGKKNEAVKTWEKAKKMGNTQIDISTKLAH